MSPKIIFLLLIIIGSSLEVLADIVLKKWSIESKGVFIALGVILYTLGTIFWAFSLKYEYLSRAAITFNLVNLILAVIAGVVLFNENLSTQNKVGVLLGIISICLIES